MLSMARLPKTRVNKENKLNHAIKIQLEDHLHLWLFLWNIFSSLQPVVWCAMFWLTLVVTFLCPKQTCQVGSKGFGYFYSTAKKTSILWSQPCYSFVLELSHPTYPSLYTSQQQSKSSWAIPNMKESPPVGWFCW